MTSRKGEGSVHGARMREAAEGAREIAREAQETAEARRARVRDVTRSSEAERGAEYERRNPADQVLRRGTADERAQHTRLVDDLETAEGQQALAMREEAAAEALRRSAGEMRQTGAEIRQVREQLEERARVVEQLAEAARELQHRASRLRQGVRADRRAGAAQGDPPRGTQG